MINASSSFFARRYSVMVSTVVFDTTGIGSNPIISASIKITLYIEEVIFMNIDWSHIPEEMRPKTEEKEDTRSWQDRLLSIMEQSRKDLEQSREMLHSLGKGDWYENHLKEMEKLMEDVKNIK